MRKTNIADIPEESTKSPSGKFHVIDKPLNDALGGDSRSMDLTKRWPFDVELTRLPSGAANYPFHAHAVAHEFYLVVSGRAIVRHKDGETEVGPGDCFIFLPGEPHQMVNRSASDVVYYCVTDNPLNDHAYYPDSDKWIVRVPESRLFLQGARKVDYYAGEDA